MTCVSSASASRQAPSRRLRPRPVPQTAAPRGTSSDATRHSQGCRSASKSAAAMHGLTCRTVQLQKCAPAGHACQKDPQPVPRRANPAHQPIHAVQTRISCAQTADAPKHQPPPLLRQQGPARTRALEPITAKHSATQQGMRLYFADMMQLNIVIIGQYSSNAHPLRYAPVAYVQQAHRQANARTLAPKQKRTQWPAIPQISRKF